MSSQEETNNEGKEMSDDEKTALFEHRYRVTSELIDSEFKYVCDLKTMIKLFVDPLRNDYSHVLPEAEINAIFSNVQTIFILNEEVYKSLKINFNDQQAGKDEKSLIGQGSFGEVFLHFVDFLKIYTLYCNNHNNSLERHTACRKKYSSYDKFISEAEENEKCQGLQLKDYLIKPIQRLCKYPLLFRELLQTTPQDHADYPFVLKTFNKVNEVATHVNQTTKAQENLTILSNFDENVSGYPGKMVEAMGTRQYLRDDALIQIIKDEHGVEKEEKRHVYLFSDIIVFTKSQKKK